MSLETVRKYANQRLYGIKNCEDILCDVKDFLFEQRIYLTPQCNADTTCFDSSEPVKDTGTSITCSIGITPVNDCNIVITES